MLGLSDIQAIKNEYKKVTGNTLSDEEFSKIRDDYRTTAATVKRSGLVTQDYKAYNKDISNSTEAVFGSPNVTTVDMMNMLNGKEVFSGEDKVKNGILPNSGFFDFVNGSLNIHQTKERKALFNTLLAIDDLTKENNASFDNEVMGNNLAFSKGELSELAKGGDMSKNASELLELKQKAAKELSGLYNSYMEGVKKPVYTTPISFRNTYYDSNGNMKTNDTYKEKYQADIASGLTNGDIQMLGFSYNSENDAVVLESGSSFDIQDEDGGVTKGVTLASAIGSGQVSEPTMLGPLTDFKTLIPELTTGKSDADIEALNAKYRNGFLYTVNVPDPDDDTKHLTKMFVVQNKGMIPDPTASTRAVLQDGSDTQTNLLDIVKDLQPGGTTPFAIQGKPTTGEDGLPIPGKRLDFKINRTGDGRYSVTHEGRQIKMGADNKPVLNDDGTPVTEMLPLSQAVLATTKAQALFKLQNLITTFDR